LFYSGPVAYREQVNPGVFVRFRAPLQRSGNGTTGRQQRNLRNSTATQQHSGTAAAAQRHNGLATPQQQQPGNITAQQPDGSAQRLPQQL
jgi:hypothetical protein